MRLLIDTHVLIWSIASPELIRPETRALIEDPQNEVFVSAASIWEIAIKHALGKPGSPPYSASETLLCADEAEFTILDMTAGHAAHAETIAHHHKDPFDHLLIAQAQMEGLTVISRDRMFALYDVTLLPA
ncbi:MAG: type II toxin-antitoxin system VapC family toxin [Beijerinckiaceae bacterium]